MIAVDTNVLVRLLTRDDEKQASCARALLDSQAEADASFFVSDVVLAELAWVLHSAYGYGRSEIAKALQALVDNATLRFQSVDTVRAALRSCESGPVGFPDCMIAATAVSAGCERTVTFDDAMTKLAGVDRLGADDRGASTA